ncbi:hypothetical protein PCY71_10335 [Streptococcus sp. SN3]|uniref:hypothetical protein n=1 Tax=Streptococcus sp. SN3 TaxID=3018246 RepID=UPI00263C0533|nr:hypothetical protein [Streptococcus sp. SN3]MDN5012754.1 hypothetical protein [Streptococcus sp. SN3]
MAYLPEDRETVIRYDELEKCWYFESNVRRHVTKILKTEAAFDSVEKELENNFCVYVRAKLSNLEDFSVNPFVKHKRKMSEEQKQAISERMRKQ